jgi:hypothetical protein
MLAVDGASVVVRGGAQLGLQLYVSEAAGWDGGERRGLYDYTHTASCARSH